MIPNICCCLAGLAVVSEGVVPTNAAASPPTLLPPPGAIPPQGMVPNNLVPLVHPALVPVIRYPFAYVSQSQMPPVLSVAGNVALPYSVAMAQPQPTPVSIPTEFVLQNPVQEAGVHVGCQKEQQQQQQQLGRDPGLEQHMVQLKPVEHSESLKGDTDSAYNQRAMDSDHVAGEQATGTTNKGSVKYERRNKKRRPHDYYERTAAPQQSSTMRTAETDTLQQDRTSPDSDSTGSVEPVARVEISSEQMQETLLQPCVPAVPTEFAQLESGVQNVSLSSQIYSDGSRTDTTKHSDIVEGASGVQHVVQRPSVAEDSVVMCPSDSVQRSIAVSPPQPQTTPSESTAPEISPMPVVPNTSDTAASPQSSPSTNAGPMLNEVSATPSSQTQGPASPANHRLQTGVTLTNQEGAPEHMPPPAASETTPNAGSQQVESTAPSRPLPEKPKVSSWAGLFKGTKTAETATVIYATETDTDTTSEKVKVKCEERKEEQADMPAPVPPTEDKTAKRLGGNTM